MGLVHSQVITYVKSPSLAFIKEHWTPLSVEEGQRRSPRTVDVEGLFAYYECDQFDKEKRTCMCYESRPEVCRNFPVYQKGGLYPEGLPLGCGYQGVEKPVKVP